MEKSLRFEISQKLKKQNKNKNLERRESGSDEGELREDREDREDRDDAAYLAESGSRKKGKNVNWFTDWFILDFNDEEYQIFGMFDFE